MEIDPVVLLAEELRATESALQSAVQRYEVDHLRENGEKFNVLVVTFDRHEGCVVQITVSPRTLALLLKDPEGMGRAITEEATTNDQ